MLLLLSLAFVLSGAAGLIYETIWTRYLGLFVGHAAYAQIIVLVIFLGGMSLGALAVGGRSARLRRPLLWYAAVEFAVGAIGFEFHGLFVRATDFAYAAIFPHLAGGAGGLGVMAAQWSLAALLILPQSVLLGATFPLMSAGALRHARAEPGRVLGLLYFTNSIGAAAGALIAGFYLIGAFGLPGTLLTAGVLNFVVALAVVAATRVLYVDDDGATAAPLPPIAESAQRPEEWRLLLTVSFGTAVASFVYEIAWIRMLSLVLGAATHSFELMLSAFILGIALGAWWIRGRADAMDRPLYALGMVQWIMGTLAVATLPLYTSSFDWMAVLIRTFDTTDAGYRGFVVARYGICLLIMLPATFCAGITLPLITKILVKRGAGERAVGAVYGVNTLGSIVGVILAGLVLMPVLGLKWLLIAGAGVDIALGVLILRPRVLGGDAVGRARFGFLAATVGFLLFNGMLVRFDRWKLSSGVFRHGLLPGPGAYTFPFYKDGRTATVSVRRSRADGYLTLATNGKPDASIGPFWEDSTLDPGALHPLQEDQSTQVLLPLIGLAHAPDARDIAVIGQGSGMTSSLLLGSPEVKQLVTVEIEPQMVNASRAFEPANHRVFDDPRSRIVIDDAKAYFAATGRRFDLIISEPSNPWVSGVSGLFTTEFYARVRHNLTPNGVLGQWLHLYEISDSLVASVLAAIDQNFSQYQVYFTSNSDILILAANRAAPLAPDWKVLAYPGIAHDLRRALPMTPEALDAMRLGGRRLLHPYLITQAQVNSDYYPVLDLGAERTRFLHQQAVGLESLGEGRFDVVAALAARPRGFATQPLPVTPEIARVDALALQARLRRVLAMTPAQRAGVPRDSALAGALYRTERFEALMAVGAPPADWHLWVDSFRDVEALLHDGSAGVADESFYGRVDRYLARAAAPPDVRAAVDFTHGLAAWDFAQASRAADTLIGEFLHDSLPWVPIPALRNGTVVARIRLGDLAGAQRAFRDMATASQPGDFVAQLLAADLVLRERDRPRRSGAAGAH
ncbi:MAG: fused MFS/spermidine synthase [Gemmatimonadota bacterium]|nr:fused MFS/spermidine synthase [Gemmatimonadota bacterium]